MLSPKSLTFLVTSTTIFPVVKRRKLGVIPCFCDSFHSFSSSHLQILPFLPQNISHIYPLLSISTCYHVFIISFISHHQNLSSGCCNKFLLSLFSHLPPCNQFLYTEIVIILKDKPRAWYSQFKFLMTLISMA